MIRKTFILCLLLLMLCPFVHAGGWKQSGGGALGSDLRSTTGDILSTTGTFTLGGVGNMNNENITLDFETTANEVHIDTTTGVQQIKLDGNLILQQEGDDRSVSISDDDPVLRVYSADQTSATDYIEMYHDQDYAKIYTPSGLIMQFDTGKIIWQKSGFADVIHWVMQSSYSQFTLGVNDSAGNQFVLTNHRNSEKDHDHAATTDPTLFIHSDTDPDTDNMQWLSLSHNKSNGYIETGEGAIVLNADTGKIILQNRTDNSWINFFIDGNTDQSVLGLEDNTGNQIIIANDDVSTNDFDHATQTNPTLYIHSDKDPDTDNTEWISLSHNQTDAVIANGSGNIILDSESQVLIDPIYGDVLFKANNTTGLIVKSNSTNAEEILGVVDATGNQLVLTNSNNYSKDHDHATTTDPTLFIHSDTDPDTDNTEWLALYHDQTDANIDVGSGNLKLNAAVTVTGDLNPEADGTRSLGTQTTAQWANVWADAVNGADFTYLNGWRTLEAEKYAGYPKGIAFGNKYFTDGVVTETVPGKPVFVVCEDFIEYQGVRITKKGFSLLAKIINFIGGLTQ